MKRFIGVALVSSLFIGCSSNGPSDGGTTTGGGTTTAGTTSTTGNSGGSSTGSSTGGTSGTVITVTINSVDVFPPAKTWLTNNGLPIPSIYDGGYEMTVSGLQLDAVHGRAVITILQTLELTPTTPPPPYVFGIDLADAGTAVVNIGLLAAIAPIGTGLTDAGLDQPQLTCPQLAAAIDAGAGSLGGAYLDYFLPAGSTVGVPLAPAMPGSVSGTVYGIPVSFASQLSCAAGVPTDDGGILATGISLYYFTQSPNGIGTPITGASVTNGANGQCYYYTNDFSSGSVTPPTDDTGVAAITNVIPTGLLPPRFPLFSPSQTLSAAPVQSNPGNVQEIFPIQL